MTCVSVHGRVDRATRATLGLEARLPYQIVSFRFCYSNPVSDCIGMVLSLPFPHFSRNDPDEMINIYRISFFCGCSLRYVAVCSFMSSPLMIRTSAFVKKR